MISKLLIQFNLRAGEFELYLNDQLHSAHKTMLDALAAATEFVRASK